MSVYAIQQSGMKRASKQPKRMLTAIVMMAVLTGVMVFGAVTFMQSSKTMSSAMMPSISVATTSQQMDRAAATYPPTPQTPRKKLN